MNALRSGGLHINCPFAEPLYGEMNETGLAWQQQLGEWWESEKPWLREQTHLESAKQRDWFFWRQKRGVVIAGRMSAAEGKLAAEWAQTLGWPLIGDVLSQTGQPLPCADRASDCSSGRPPVRQKSTGWWIRSKDALTRRTIAVAAW